MPMDFEFKVQLTLQCIVDKELTLQPIVSIVSLWR